MTSVLGSRANFQAKGLEEPSVIREGLRKRLRRGKRRPLKNSVLGAYASRDATQSTRSTSVSQRGLRSGTPQKEAQYELYDHRGTGISSGVWKRKRDDYPAAGRRLMIRQVFGTRLKELNKWLG